VDSKLGNHPARINRVLREEQMAESRVFTYTRTYRIELDLSDEELIERATVFADVVNATARRSRPMDPPQTVQDALDVITDIMSMVGIGSPNNVKIELHNTKLDQSDPGFF
jgi:hypothetical protein